MSRCTWTEGFSHVGELDISGHHVAEAVPCGWHGTAQGQLWHIPSLSGSSLWKTRNPSMVRTWTGMAPPAVVPLCNGTSSVRRSLPVFQWETAQAVSPWSQAIQYPQKMQKHQELYFRLQALISRLMDKVQNFYCMLKVLCSRLLWQIQLPPAVTSVNGGLLLGTSGDGGCQAEEGGFHSLPFPKDPRSSWCLLGDCRFCGFICKCWTTGGVQRGHIWGLLLFLRSCRCLVTQKRKAGWACLEWRLLTQTRCIVGQWWNILRISLVQSPCPNEEEPLPPKSVNYFRPWRQKLSR